MDAEKAEKIVEGSNNYDYLARSVAIVTILYERGILQELFDGDRINLQEIEQRLDLIKSKFALFPEDEKSERQLNESDSISE